MSEFTLIVPYYRNCAMLERQVEEWNRYPEGVRVICVDDGSPDPALPIILAGYGWPLHRDPCDCEACEKSPKLYRIGVDIPWNRGGARNLGALMAHSDWIVHVDIDHILPADAAAALLEFNPDPSRWYRFPRWRVGKADETRRKDAIADDAEYGEIHPHVDSYLITKKLYWEVGGYDEDYSGSLGGGNPFLRRLEKIAGAPGLLSVEGRGLRTESDLKAQSSALEPIRLEVYTRSVIKDASDWSLSRDKARYSGLWREKERNGDTKPRNPIRFPWVREL